ncbi:Cell division cycle protein 123-like protein [Hypsibius exemplaris]|uniref:Cell division cycle protein 123-like protein n=1 Tax=Hypsibius exemplaris TaxID=2072580 RepID=A0A1W0WUN9_HYPEX|nr:Cell division cycle protein 123-like protein [Hypsibius exemplaris]
MIPEDIASFSFASWYPLFKQHTFKSEIIALSDQAVTYLREDGIFLPDGLEKRTTSNYTAGSADDTSGSADDTSGSANYTSGSANYTSGSAADTSDHDDITAAHQTSVETEWSSDDEDKTAQQWVLDLKARVDEVIRKFGGAAFPKLNWSSPKDACWMLPNRNLKCSSLADILLVLKASTFVGFDLSIKVQEAARVPLDLVLREWSEINPGWEFRCFVKDNTLVGISQRYTTAFYAHINQNRENVTGDIKAFFAQHVQQRFPLKNYTFDIVTFTTDTEDFMLVDFNPFDPVTDSLLFTWEELQDANGIPDDELLRIVSYPLAIQPDDMRQYEVPADFMDSRFSTNGRSLFDFLGAELGSQGASDEENLN